MGKRGVIVRMKLGGLGCFEVAAKIFIKVLVFCFKDRKLRASATGGLIRIRLIMLKCLVGFSGRLKLVLTVRGITFMTL